MFTWSHKVYSEWYFSCLTEALSEDIAIVSLECLSDIESAGQSDTESMALVSVAMATYNGAQFLKQQLDSIFAQDYANFEIVVCDDNSQDSTVDILNSERYASESVKKGVPLKIYQNDDNLGYVKNFQRAVEHCSGQYIVFCDQDDVWRADKLSCLLLHIRKKASLAVFSDATLVDTNGVSLGANLLESVIGSVPPEDISYKAFYLSNCVTGCTMMIDRRLLDSALPFADNVPHDWWLAYHAAYHGGLCFLNERLIDYRQHDNNVYGLGSAVRKRRFKYYWRHKLAKWSMSYQLVKHNRNLLGTYHRLHAMHDFEVTTPKGSSEELELLLKWISDKFRGASLNQYRDFFTSSTEAFQLFVPSKMMLESYDDSVRRLVRQTLTSGLVAVIIVFLLMFAILYPAITLLSI